MAPVVIVLIVIAAILVGVTIVLAVLGKKAQKRQAEQDEQIQATAQQYTMLIIDKRKMKMTEAGLPDSVTANTPWYTKRAKVPVVKAKVGPKVMTLLCDESVFKVLPIKKECKVVISGLYITEIKSARGGIPQVPKKKTLRDRISGVLTKKRDRKSVV